jgi:hypothetical protein
MLELLVNWRNSDIDQEAEINMSVQTATTK